MNALAAEDYLVMPCWLGLLEAIESPERKRVKTCIVIPEGERSTQLQEPFLQRVHRKREISSRVNMH
jgi:hypothetical protein